MSCIANESLSEAYRHCQRDLLRAGLLLSMEVDGLYGFSGAFENVLEGFDQLVTRRASAQRAEIIRFPGVINRAHYLRTTHMDNFPDLMGSVHSFEGNDKDHFKMLDQRKRGVDWTSELAPTEIMMAPAVCYPLYPTAKGVLPEAGRTIDLRGSVFRHEPSIDPARMQIFRQREFVRLGTPEQALSHRDYWVALGQEILSEVGLEAKAEVANDPFFGRGGKLMASAQKEQVLKFELVHAVASEEKPIAVASSNYHQNYFGHTFGIQTANGEEAHTACVGFGLERVVLALFMKHGFDPDLWPSDVKSALGL
jgi:seryl-tRNA synthetase